MLLRFDKRDNTILMEGRQEEIKQNSQYLHFVPPI